MWIVTSSGAPPGVYIVQNDYFHSRCLVKGFLFYSVDKFGVHQKGKYGFCDPSCSSMSSVTIKADEQMTKDDHDPVVFEEELPIILNNPL